MKEYEYQKCSECDNGIIYYPKDTYITTNGDGKKIMMNTPNRCGKCLGTGNQNYGYDKFEKR